VQLQCNRISWHRLLLLRRRRLRLLLLWHESSGRPMV
jgi:hypothetical protein